MKEKEEKYINHLFESARQETPKRSFEDVAQHFEKAVIPPSPTGYKELLTKFINLNSLIMLSITSLIVASFIWFNTDVDVATKNTGTDSITTAPITTIQKIEEVVEPKQIESFSPSIELSNAKTTFQNDERTTVKEKINNVDVSMLEKTETTTSQEAIKEATRQTSNYSITKADKLITEKDQLEDITKKESIATNINDNLLVTNSSNASTKPKVLKTTKAPSAKTTNTSTSTVSSSRKQIAEKATNKEAQLSAKETPTASLTTFERKLVKLVKSETTFILNYTDDSRQTNFFAETIRTYGFNINFTDARKSRYIEKLNLNIRHHKGLEWRIKLRGFEQLEIKLLLDKNKMPVGIAYRLNQNGDFSKALSLSANAKSIHRFSKNNHKTRHSFTISNNF